jgi:hypothetical protein
MSRRNPKSGMPDPVDGEVRLWCPWHHELGMIVVRQSNRSRFVRGHGENNKGVFTSEPEASKLKVRCTACEEAGRHLDLQASWDRITGLALKNLDDRTHRAEDVTLGGQAGA